MEPLIIPDTKGSPLIVLDPGAGKFLLAGSSVVENTNSFFAPAVEWMRKHAAELPPGCCFEFRLDYFNTSSLKAILFLLSAVQEANVLHGRGHRIQWHVEDEDEFMEDAASHVEAVLGMTVERVAVNSASEPMDHLQARYRIRRSGAA